MLKRVIFFFFAERREEVLSGWSPRVPSADSPPLLGKVWD